MHIQADSSCCGSLQRQRLACSSARHIYSDYSGQHASETAPKFPLTSLISYPQGYVHPRCLFREFSICPFCIQFWVCLFLAAPFDRGKSLLLYGVFLPNFRALSPTPKLGSACTILHLLPSLRSTCAWCAEREQLRDTSWHPSRAPRALHPARGQRIGEAAVPGPPKTTSPSPRDLASPDDDLPGMLSDNLRDTSCSARGSQNGPPPPVAPLVNDVYILRPHNRDIRLTCGWMPKFRSWRWSCGSGADRWQHQSCLSPIEAALARAVASNGSASAAHPTASSNSPVSAHSWHTPSCLAGPARTGADYPTPAFRKCTPRLPGGRGSGLAYETDPHSETSAQVSCASY